MHAVVEDAGLTLAAEPVEPRLLPLRGGAGLTAQVAREVVAVRADVVTVQRLQAKGRARQSGVDVVAELGRGEHRTTSSSSDKGISTAVSFVPRGIWASASTSSR